MAIIQYGIAAGKAGNSLLDTLSGYFVRYRLTLYLLSAAAVVLGVVLNWNWLTAAGLFRVVAVLPCAFMMFSCIRPGTRRSDHETALHHGALPSSSDPQRSLSPRLDRNTSSGSPVNDLWHLLRKSRLIPNHPSEMNHDDGRHDARNDVGDGVCLVAGDHRLDPGSSSSRQISALLKGLVGK